jgi:hypothetical protein
VVLRQCYTAAKNSVITVLLPSERRQATGHRAGTWPGVERSGAGHILTADHAGREISVGNGQVTLDNIKVDYVGTDCDSGM